jgi:hypothetical protein
MNFSMLELATSASTNEGRILEYSLLHLEQRKRGVFCRLYAVSHCAGCRDTYQTRTIAASRPDSFTSDIKVAASISNLF